MPLNVPAGSTLLKAWLALCDLGFRASVLVRLACHVSSVVSAAKIKRMFKMSAVPRSKTSLARVPKLGGIHLGHKAHTIICMA